MTAAGGIGANIGKRERVGRSIPDDVVAPPPDGGVIVPPRHRIAEQLLAFGQAERVKLENLAMDVGRHLPFVEHRAPGDVAGINRLRLRQKLRAHRGADAIGADEQIAALNRAVGE